MNLYAGLLFNQGHIADVELARSLAGLPPSAAIAAQPVAAPQPAATPTPVLAVNGGPRADRRTLITRCWTALSPFR